MYIYQIMSSSFGYLDIILLRHDHRIYNLEIEKHILGKLATTQKFT